MTIDPVSLLVRTLKAEVTETPLNECVTWPLSAKNFTKFRTAHQVLLRVIGFRCRQRTDHAILSYVKVLKKDTMR